MRNIEFENSVYGNKAIIKGQWNESYAKILTDKEINELELNSGKGWIGNQVDFLKFLPNLKSLIIIDFNIDSIDGIHFLKNLLNLQLLTHSKNPINFNIFTNLISCDFEWVKGSNSLFNCNSIKRLGINKYIGLSDEFAKLIQMESLTIMNSSFEKINSFYKLRNLKYLNLTNLKKLNSLEGIGDLVQLEILEIEHCKNISSTKELIKLINIERLLLINLADIDSLEGIKHMTLLKEFFFYESTNVIDGDLSPLLSLHNLNSVSYQNRKHYSHKREEFI